MTTTLGRLAVVALLALTSLSFAESRRHGHAEKQHALSCKADNEGSWSIGVYRGASFSSLLPIEEALSRLDGSAAWPVANPILTCAAVVGAPSNFVADPFLFRANGTIYMFHETKNGITGHGDIGVASSHNDGSTWRHLGVALDEPWHLSYPFVFSWKNQVYLLPEASRSGGLRLYRAENFPLVWKLDRLLLDKPLVDASLLKVDDTWWLFGSDHTRPGAHNNGELELFSSASPQGPWQAHPMSPIMNTARRRGARMGGRPLHYKGAIYRFAQDCTSTYGKALEMMEITILNATHYQEEPRELGFTPAPRRGPMAWNGAHLVDGQYSKFTLVTQSYDQRLVNLKLFAWHYSRCTSVGEILVVWNRGTPPDPSSFSSKVPLRFRTESRNSLNNRFWPDEHIRNRAVLSLDDDILFSCKDLENGFASWRQHPERLVGFYPRLAEGAPLVYSDNKPRMKAAGHYNIILAGGTFVDKAYYNDYWSPQHAEAREMVDELTNCEDLLLNFVVANATRSAGDKSVLYVRPRVRIHAWRLSGVGISSQYRPFARDRSTCMLKFEELFGGNVLQTTRFDQRNIQGRMP
ncbi:hypothetical protein WJX84_006539 [Apatococcus fuscideae]|uniref:Glycosyl transferase 64 domain-containing protein n=1 Tax=Apatococcus fuscideae TaxID=2026836 RepID=A0AAW1SYN5_9CHLO